MAVVVLLSSLAVFCFVIDFGSVHCTILIGKSPCLNRINVEHKFSYTIKTCKRIHVYYLMGSQGLTKGSLMFLNYPAQIMFKSTKVY
jgi:hypothetical protein